MGNVDAVIVSYFAPWPVRIRKRMRVTGEEEGSSLHQDTRLGFLRNSSFSYYRQKVSLDKTFTKKSQNFTKISMK